MKAKITHTTNAAINDAQDIIYEAVSVAKACITNEVHAVEISLQDLQKKYKACKKACAAALTTTSEC